MFARFSIVAGLILLAGCVRGTRAEKVTQPVDTGLPFSFGDEAGPLLSWDFADGSPPAIAKSVRHPFAKAGHYVVTAKGGERLAWRVELEVIPRAISHAVPADAEALLFAESTKDDFTPTVDFLERLVGAESASRYLEASVLPALAVDASAGEGLADPREGVGLFLLPGFDGQISTLGIIDEGKTLSELQTRLGERARLKTSGDGVLLGELADGSRLAGFVDRGYAYVVLADPGADPMAAVNRVRKSSARGLLDAPLFAASQTAGNLRLYASAVTGPGERQFDAVHVGFTVSGSTARISGEVISRGPLWPLDAKSPLKLFAQGPADPVAALQLTLPHSTLAALLMGQADGPRRGRYRAVAKQLGVDLDQWLATLSGDVGALAYFDAEGFLRNLIDGSMRPEPRGTLLIEGGLTDAKTFEAGLSRAFSALSTIAPKRDRSGDTTTFTGRWAEQTVQLAVSPQLFRVQGGALLQGRGTVAIGEALAERFEGAFSPGHASLLIDVGRLRRELEQPRMLTGLDPTRVVTVQGFASAFLDQLTPIDFVVLDLVPTATGAALSGRMALKEKEK